MSKAIEIAMFRMTEGTSKTTFIEASSAMVDWLQKQSGFLSRNMSNLEDGSWIDIVYWESTQAAKAAAEKFMQDLGDCAFMRMIDPESVKMIHGNIKVES